MPSDFDSARWNVEHTDLVNRLIEELEELGCELFIERQNSFRVQSANSGMVVSGKPDVIARFPDDRTVIYDAKTGQQFPEPGQRQAQRSAMWRQARLSAFILQSFPFEVIDVWCHGFSLSFIPLLHWEDLSFVADVAEVKTEHAFATAAAPAVEFFARQDLRFDACLYCVSNDLCQAF